jgi:hypothetical protein
VNTFQATLRHGLLGIKYQGCESVEKGAALASDTFSCPNLTCVC